MQPKPHKQLVIALGLVEHDGRFLIQRRVDVLPMWHGKWEIPGGKVQRGESPQDAVVRELQEETGLVLTNPVLLGVYTHHWQHPEFEQQTFMVLYRLASSSTDVTLKPDECDAHRWVTIDEFFAIDEHLDGNVAMLRALYAPLVS